jgi:hypothetical protein
MAMGIRALGDLCDGHGDATAISQILHVKNDDNTFVWRVPHMPGVSQGRPTMRGRLLMARCQAAACAVANRMA